MTINLLNCGSVKPSYFSESLVNAIIANCESDVFKKVYHVNSINKLITDSVLKNNFTENDKIRVKKLILNNYIWLRFK